MKKPTIYKGDMIRREDYNAQIEAIARYVRHYRLNGISDAVKIRKRKIAKARP